MAMAVEADEELELSLGLSLGGRVLRKKSESPRTVPVMDLGFEGGVSTVEAYGDGGDLGKKCEEKERKRGFFFGNVGLVDVEAQQFRSRARDRAKRETEASRSEGQRKEGEKCNEKNLAVTLDSSYPPQANSKSCPMVPMQFPVHPVQYLPVGYGYPSPCVMPFWAPPSAQGATPPGKGPVLDTPAVPPAAFRPFRRGNQPVPGNADSEQSVGKAVSGGGSPSQTSDNQSAYLQGGCSTESGSHSSCSPREHPQRQLSQHASAAQACSDYAIVLPHAEEADRNSIAQPSAEKPQGTASETKPILVSPSVFSLSPPRPVSASLVTSSCCPNPSEERTNENREQQLPCQGIPALPKMPCVSTTGNGPNGKTITGFLYKYTKTEVSIVCVCHGSSFSPAEFVKHAGGTDVSHPLKHIVVVPTTF